jgi:HPt (histidine-containing phosphotransfer) domain-containing protein
MSNACVENEWLYSTLADDPDLGELAEMYVEEMPGRMDELLALSAERKWPELARKSHQLKGAAGSYGFDQITPCAQQLETAARRGQSEEQIRAALDKLIALCKRLRAGAG